MMDDEEYALTPCIQVLGKSKVGKTTFISQLMNHSVLDGRFEHTSTLEEYNVHMRLDETNVFRPEVPCNYNVNIYDVPGEASVRIDANSFEFFLLKQINKGDISPLTEDAKKLKAQMEQKRLKYVATGNTFGADTSLEDTEKTHLLNDYIVIDEDTILDARNVIVREKGSTKTNLNGGYIVMFDLVDHDATYEKAKTLITRIRSQSVLVPIVLFANKVETCRTPEGRKIRATAKKFAHGNDAGYFEGSALMNYVTSDAQSFSDTAIGNGRQPEQKVDVVVNWIIHRYRSTQKEKPVYKPPESDVVCCSTLMKYTICLPFVLLNAILSLLFHIICCCPKTDSGDANDL